jgi:hypothetical protein
MPNHDWVELDNFINFIRYSKVTSNIIHFIFHCGQFLETNFCMDLKSQKFRFKNGCSIYGKKVLQTYSKCQFTWMNNNQFYSLTSATNAGDKLFFCTARDKTVKFYLRKDRNSKKKTTRHHFFNGN